MQAEANDSAGGEVVAQAVVSAEFDGQRLDRVVAAVFAEHSRSRLQRWIRSGELTVNGEMRRPRDPVAEGDQLALSAQIDLQTDDEPEPIALDIVFEDEALLVLNKPAGLVAHPAAGNPSGTLLNALLHHHAPLAGVPRAGLVHRLDKATTGLLVVAKTLESHTALVAAMQRREIRREYETLVRGVMISGQSIDAPIARHPVDRKRFAVADHGRPSVTHVRVLERFEHHSRLAVRLETGRTHQIRVHLHHARYPIVGDPVYGGRLTLPAGASDSLIEALRGFRRQALHARKLGLEHPLTGQTCEWEAPLPDDHAALLAVFRNA